MPLPNDIRMIVNLDRATEALIVLGSAFGAPVYASTVYALWLRKHPDWAARHAMFTDAGLQLLFGSQLITVLVLLAFLWIRGWTPERLGLAVGPRGAIAGLALALTAYIAAACILAAAAHVWPDTYAVAVKTMPHQFALTLPTIIVTSSMNGAFEELFLCGFLISTQGSDRQRAILAVLSMILRLSYHTYQGPVGFLSILVLGSLQTLYFVRTRRLWPVIVSHIAIDIAGLAMMP